MNTIKNTQFKYKFLCLVSAIALLLLAYSVRAIADTQYLSTEQFLQTYLTAETPKPSKLWLGKEQAKKQKKS